MLIAQLSDTHVVAPDATEELFVDNNARLESAVMSINEEAPAVEAVLVTGDLTNNGTRIEFEQLTARLSKLAAPTYVLPGNHDDRSLVREFFPGQPWVDAEHASWLLDLSADLRIVALDTTIPGEPGGEVDEARLAWLADAIDGASGRCLLAMHHPPFLTGVQWMDNSGFIGLASLVELLGDHPVDRIACGHFHRPVTATVAGITAQVGLSTVQHVDLDLAPGAPISLIDDPVGYLLHVVADTGWVSHTRFFDTGAERVHPQWAKDPS